MKNCPLCDKPIENGQNVVAILGARYNQKETGAAYDLEVTRQAILSHFQCPQS